QVVNLHGRSLPDAIREVQYPEAVLLSRTSLSFAGRLRSSRYNRHIDLDPHNRRRAVRPVRPGLTLVVLLGRTQSCNYLTKRLATIINLRSRLSRRAGPLARSFAPKT